MTTVGKCFVNFYWKLKNLTKIYFLFQMITKVFRDLIQKHNIAEPHEIEAIFSNINEIVELTVTLIG